MKAIVTARGGEGYAEYTVTNKTNGRFLYISHPECGWIVFGRYEGERFYSDPFVTKREAVEYAASLLNKEK